MKNFKMDKKKRKTNKKSSADASSNFKESVLISKRNFHKLLSSSSIKDKQPRKVVMRSKTGRKRKFDEEEKDEIRELGFPKTNYSTAATEEEIASTSLAAQRRGVGHLFNMLPMDTSRGLHRLVSWLSSSSKRINWDPNTFEIYLDGTKKKGSNIVDILTFLWKDVDDTSTYPSAHTFGVFIGIPMSTTHFLRVMGEEMYSFGLIKTNPYPDEERHLEELATLLNDTYGLEYEKIKHTLELSRPERERITANIEEAKLEKERKEMVKEMKEADRIALQETLDKIHEAEERERLRRASLRQRAAEISGDTEKFQREQGAYTKIYKRQLPSKHRTTTTRKTIDVVKKKIAKRGPPKWLQQPTLLKQIADDSAVQAETAYRMQVRDVLKQKDLSEEDKKKQLKTIGEQMSERFHSLRSTKKRLEEEEERQRRNRLAAAESDNPEDVAERRALIDAVMGLDEDEEESLDEDEEEKAAE